MDFANPTRIIPLFELRRNKHCDGRRAAEGTTAARLWPMGYSRSRWWRWPTPPSHIVCSGDRASDLQLPCPHILTNL